MMRYVWNEEVFEKVKSGEWTFEQFEAWAQERDESRYNDGYADAREEADGYQIGE